jgi:hypothetical protein
MSIGEAFEAGLSKGIEIGEEEDLMQVANYSLGIACLFMGIVLVCMGGL